MFRSCFRTLAVILMSDSWNIRFSSSSSSSLSVYMPLCSYSITLVNKKIRSFCQSVCFSLCLSPCLSVCLSLSLCPSPPHPHPKPLVNFDQCLTVWTQWLRSAAVTHISWVCYTRQHTDSTAAVGFCLSPTMVVGFCWEWP